jgi:hypothetical protein
MMWVQTWYHKPNPPFGVIAYWASISRIFLKSFEQKSLKKSWKIFKIFITLLRYGLHKTFAKNMSFSKKFKSIYKSFYCLKALVTMLLGIFHSLDRFQNFRLYIPIHWK